MADNQALQLRSTIKPEGELEISLARVPVPEPGPDEILVRVDATPINPSDLGLLIGPADLSTGKLTQGPNGPVFTAKIPEQIMRMVAARAGESMPVGNEGGGVVVGAGSSPAAQALMGKTVGILGGAMYAQYRVVRAADALVMPDGTSARDAASCFVNPLTALSFPEVMRMEGHSGLVHTAAASNLGQMLVKICKADGVPLVNIVRSDAQTKILKDIGAEHVVDSSKPSFMQDLIAALSATNATLGFDAIGGGTLAGQILSAMEVAANMKGGAYSRYGSTTYKQVYIYGGLDTSPTILQRAFGMSWGLGGWLLTPFMQKAGPEVMQRLRKRVVDEIHTTFASHYTHEISLAEALNPETIVAYNRKATGEKYLINPNKGV